VIWLTLTREVDYIEKGPAPPNQRTLMRKLRRLAGDFALPGIDFNKAVHVPSKRGSSRGIGRRICDGAAGLLPA
jgi:hypothetical protein